MENNITIPKHIGIIMDGNGRWAKKRLLPRNMGHKKGAEVFQDITRYCNELGLEAVTFYAFSTENWKRPKEEVDFLMNLLMNYLLDAERTLAGENVRIRAIGSRKELTEEMQEQIIKTEKFTSKNTGIVMNIALNYGSREELVTATKNIAEKVKNGEISAEDITPDTISRELYTGGQPDPDLIIRTSNEQRLSNFLMWQSSYSELYFTKTLWPDFNLECLYDAILAYQNRDRRYGGVK